MVDVKKLLAKMLTEIKANTTDIASINTKLTRAPLIKTVTANVSSGNVAANGWASGKTISWTTPSGYTALPGVVSTNSGYMIVYNNGWQKGDTSVTVSFHNIGTVATTATAYANVIFVRSDMLTSIS